MPNLPENQAGPSLKMASIGVYARVRPTASLAANLAAWPALAEHPLRTCFAAALRPGDAAFIPAGWWHDLRSVGTTVAANFWVPSLGTTEALILHTIASIQHAAVAEPDSLLEEFIRRQGLAV